MLQDVGWSWIKFEQFWLQHQFLDVARCCVRLVGPLGVYLYTINQAFLYVRGFEPRPDFKKDQGRYLGKGPLCCL